jgi:serine-type D-Ala-D-Ala carboxypeptidase/endopeptidase (penicillin-binding protein 4)
MSKMISRRFFMGTAAASVLAVRGAASQPPEVSLRPVLRGVDAYRQSIPTAEEIIAKQGITGDVAFAVADVKTGTRLEGHDMHEGTPPASVAKALTALYALGTLGPEHRFETRVIATGGIVEGEVQGDLVLVGGGDPTLDSDGLGQLAAQMKDAGIIGVKGGFKVYENLLPVSRQIDPEQPIHVGYNPSLAGIALNYNRVHFEWARGDGGYDVTMEGRSVGYRPAVAVARMEVIDRKGPVYTYEDRFEKDNWTVARGALGNGGARWLPVRRPGLYAGDVFATICGAEGIRLNYPKIVEELPEGEVVATLKSAPLNDILRDMLKYSTNLTAEMVGMMTTLARLGEVSSLKASAAEMNRWAIAELGLIAPKMVDHSGLGDDSRLTAADMVRALVAANGAGLRPILKSIPLKDEKGRPVRDHPVQVAAKTGTLNFVSGLAGYITTRDGTDLAFAIFTADVEQRASIPREEREGPPGARAWNGRAKRIQQALIKRWDALYGG